MRIAERLARLEGRATNFSWAAMCTANERHIRRQAYQTALQIAERLGVAVEVHEPPKPDPQALAAYERKYGEQIRAEAPAVMAKLLRLCETRAGDSSMLGNDAGGEQECTEQDGVDRFLLDYYVQLLEQPEREYRMIA